jgi:hypothetical protein
MAEEVSAKAFIKAATRRLLNQARSHNRELKQLQATAGGLRHFKVVLSVVKLKG